MGFSELTFVGSDLTGGLQLLRKLLCSINFLGYIWNNISFLTYVMAGKSELIMNQKFMNEIS